MTLSGRNMFGWALAALVGAFGIVAGQAAPVRAADPAPVAPATSGGPEDCGNGKDDDGDTVFDCGDADCDKDPRCQPDGADENSDARCSDWVDNDKDGVVDCDDDACFAKGIKVCQGSWDRVHGALKGGGAGADDDGNTDSAGGNQGSQGGRTEDLIGKDGDKDGERSDEVCADGVDNDNDGRTDCADYGCRFDASVAVCRESPGMRFSVVGHITNSYDIEADEMDTRFSVLQLRAFGPIPFIQDSFFLLSIRAEKTPRLTFAMFQVPLGKGHYLNINSGGGGLSTALIRSASKQLLIDPPFYLYSAFEQGNGAAAEVGGPLNSANTLEYRVFAGGGSGRFNGNVGGRFFTFDNMNYTWSAGAQLGVSLVGHISRWDNPMLYTPVPTSLGLFVGAKYDQRAQERYPAMNLNLTMRSGGFIGSAEAYVKRELEFGSWQFAYNVTLGYLAIPKYLMFGADIGQFLPGEMDEPPLVAETDIAKQLKELQFRVGAHWFFYRNVGVLSLIYSDRTIEAADPGAEDTHERILKLVGQFRF